MRLLFNVIGQGLSGKLPNRVGNLPIFGHDRIIWEAAAGILQVSLDAGVSYLQQSDPFIADKSLIKPIEQAREPCCIFL